MIGAEVGVKDAASEQPIDGGEDGGGDGDNRLARATSCCDAGEESTKVTTLLGARRPGRLDEQGLEPRGSFAKLGGVALAGAFVVARAQTGPGDQVCGGREARHVEPISETMTATATPACAGAGAADAGDRGGIGLGEVDAQQQALVVGDAAAQGFDELRAGGPDPGMDLGPDAE
jgi:hypothetical protein